MKRKPTHPGEILLVEFLIPAQMGVDQLAYYAGLPMDEVEGIVWRERNVSVEAAAAFARVFGTSAEFWLNAQAAYDGSDG